jgi:hypothetical protein
VSHLVANEVKIKQIGEKFHGMNAFVLSPQAYAYILMS